MATVLVTLPFGYPLAVHSLASALEALLREATTWQQPAASHYQAQQQAVHQHT